MTPQHHRQAQWQKIFLDSIVIWTLLSIVLSLCGTSPTWCLGISLFVCSFLAATMLYLNKGNLLSDEEVLAIIRKNKGQHI